MDRTSPNISSRLVAVVYGLLIVTSVATIIVLRRGDDREVAQRPKPYVTLQRPTSEARLLPPTSTRHELAHAATIIPATAESTATSEPSAEPIRVAQLLPPVIEPLPEVETAPPPPTVREVPIVPAPVIAAPTLPAPDLTPPTAPVADAPNPQSFAATLQAEPYRIGSFTQYGTITPADVRAIALQNNKDIAVIGRIPQVNRNLIDVELAAFDPVFNIALNGGRYNRQTSTQIQSLGSNVPVLKTDFWLPINGLNQVYLEKFFVTGGKVQVGLGQTYYNYSPAGGFVTINPAYQSSLNILAEQPLFRGRGPAATTAPMQIARANHEQTWHVFRATVNAVLRDAENAYWETYAAYQDFEVRDIAYRQALETVERERGRLQLGEGSVPDVAQAEEQCEAFHIARTTAQNRLIAAERALRRLLGLPPADPRPIVPATPPSDAPLSIDWDHAAASARQRPEFAAQQAAVEAIEIELARRQNGLLPDLSVQAIYSVTGLDSHFGDAWGIAGTWAHNSWTAGVVYKQPIGRRSDRAFADRATAALALETARLQQLEHEILHQLDAAYQNVQAAQRMLELHRRRREAAAVQLAARRELYLENRAALRDQLDAEARYASALYDESLARVNYQKALTDWNFARGEMGDGDVVLAP